MTREELVTELVAAVGTHRAQVEEMLDALGVAIGEALTDGDKVQIRGLGSFEAKRRGGGVIRDPKTGKQITYGPGKRVVFRAAGALREAASRSEDR